MNDNRTTQHLFGPVASLVVAIMVSLGLVLSFTGDGASAADKKPPKKSTKSSGKGLDDLKTPEVTPSEGTTATAIRGKPGHSEGDEEGKKKTTADSEEGTVKPAQHE